MGAEPNYTLCGTDARMAALEKQVLLLRGDLQRAYGEIAECRRIIQEKDDEIAALKNDNIRLTGEVNALNEAMRRLASEGGDGKLLRRYENPHNPGDTSWNDRRKELLDDERRYEAAQKGEYPKDPKIGPPAGHPGTGAPSADRSRPYHTAVHRVRHGGICHAPVQDDAGL